MASIRQSIVKGKVIGDVISRSDGSFETHIVTAVDGKLYRLFWNSSHVQIVKGNYYAFTNVRVNDLNKSISFVDTSEVFDKKPFDYVKTEEDGFLNADVVSIPEILASPRKRRVSVKGFVDVVGETAHSGVGSPSKWSRKDVTLRCDNTKSSVVVKFWNDHIAKAESLAQGEEVTIANVETREFKEQVELCSTPESSVRFEEKKKTSKIYVDAMKRNGDSATLLSDDGLQYTLKKDVNAELFERLWEMIPVRLEVSHQGAKRVITVISVIDDAKKQK